MRNLISRRLGTRQGDRGAIGVLVAILIGAGVLFGMGAMVIDVGQLYQNRAELQNGADAAALAVAKSCAEGSCTPSIAAQYADANASTLTGGTAYVDGVCGVNGNATVGLGTCVPSQSVVCAANPPTGTNYVDVETSTELPNGSHLLPPVFARTLAGNGSYQGSTVYACAQAEWGTPLTGNTAGITIGLCDWSEATSNGTSYAPAPPYPPNPASQPIIIDFHDPSGQESDSTCPSGPAGQTASGNFGWTQGVKTNCTLTSADFTYTAGSYTYGGIPGNKKGNSGAVACESELSTAQSNQQVLYMPVYASYNGKGSNATYTLAGLAAFAITGYNFGNKVQAVDRITGQLPCSGTSVTCISGYFLKDLIPPGTVATLGGASLGVSVIKLTG